MNKIRKYWVDTMLKIVSPVLENLAKDQLKENMPVETTGDIEDRKQFTYLEAFGRTLVGITPWIALKNLTGEEEEERQKYAKMIRTCLAVSVDPDQKDRMNFSEGFQPIVDAAFLCQGLLRAYDELWMPLEEKVKNRLLEALRQTRTRKAPYNNWLLFCGIIEAFLYKAGAKDWDPMRIDYALRQFENWYVGDGVYSDGVKFHWDYYNSFVIQPMLMDILHTMQGVYRDWDVMLPACEKRFSHYAAVLEHLIAPDGSYPLVGRSLVYRFGAFQALSMSALEHTLEEGIFPSQVRCGLTEVIKKTMSYPALFDEKGFLRVGVCGSQLHMGEPYISTGSLYLCTGVFLPLGLPETDPFWQDEERPWTQKYLWQGEDHECEHAID